MKKISLVLLVVLMAFTFLGASKPSLDGRAEVANYGELPAGLFAKSPGYLPGDTVIVTNPQANISIEVMVFGSFDATEGIAIILSPEAAKELYITKGSNVIVQVTKKSDAYYENTILSKTLETYIPETDVDAESEALLQDPVFAELVKESIAEEVEAVETPEEVVIPMEDILFEEILATEEEIPEEVIAEEVVEEIPEEVIAEEIVEEIPEEVIAEEVVEEIPEEVIAEEVVEEIPEEVIAEEIVEEIPEEVIAEEVVEEIPEEVIAEEVVEEIPEEVIAEEDLSKIPQTLPDWSEERPIPDFGFSDEIEDSETSEEFIAEMTRGMEVKPDVETTEEVALVPTEPKPPVFTIIPVPVEEEILEDDSILEEPEVVFVEEVDEVEDKQENSESEEVLVFLDAKMILNNEDDLEIEEVVYSAVKPVNSLPVDKYYVQIATYSKYENMEAIVKKYGKNYPIVVYQPSGRNDYQVMIGGLNKDEYAIVLERFRKAGYKDAFLRSTF